MSEFSHDCNFYFPAFGGNHLHAIMIQQAVEFWSSRSAAGPGGFGHWPPCLRANPLCMHVGPIWLLSLAAAYSPGIGDLPSLTQCSERYGVGLGCSHIGKYAMGSAFLQSWTTRGGRAQTLGLQQGSGSVSACLA